MHDAASWRVVMADVGEKGVLWPALVLSEEQLQALVNKTHHIQVSHAHTNTKAHTQHTHTHTERGVLMGHAMRKGTYAASHASMYLDVGLVRPCGR
jgi:hypothetical protein